MPCQVSTQREIRPPSCHPPSNKLSVPVGAVAPRHFLACFYFRGLDRHHGDGEIVSIETLQPCHLSVVWGTGAAMAQGGSIGASPSASLVSFLWYSVPTLIKYGRSLGWMERAKGTRPKTRLDLLRREMSKRHVAAGSLSTPLYRHHKRVFQLWSIDNANRMPVPNGEESREGKANNGSAQTPRLRTRLRPDHHRGAPPDSTSLFVCMCQLN